MMLEMAVEENDECISKIVEIFQEFSMILSEITAGDYSDEEKEEMINHLNAQIKEKLFELIHEFLSSGINNRIEIDSLGDDLINILSKARGYNNQHSELFLEIFDGVLSYFDQAQSQAGSMGDSKLTRVHDLNNTPTKVSQSKLRELSRKNEILIEEVKVLKQELEEKNNIEDKLESVKRNNETLLYELNNASEKCSDLVNENNALKAQLYKEQKVNELKLKEFKSREEKLFSEINALKDSISVKGVLLKTFENEKEVMFTDFQLLSEEVVERDLIIQSLNEATNENKDNVAFLLDMTSEVSISGEELTSTAKLRIPTLECENCSKKSNSFNLLNVSLRRRNIPSPLFDDSVQSMNNSALVLEPIQPIQPLILPSKTKSLGEELLEVNNDKNILCKFEEKRKIMMTELNGLLYLNELELQKTREKLELSIKKLRRQNNSEILTIRHRVYDGVLNKMFFTKYEGFRLLES